jgi:myo-inositol-1(or 4)-monophosphatase
VTITQEERKHFLVSARDVALMAGARAEHFARKRDALVIEEKGAQDFVTNADKAVEALIVEELKRRFPDHAFFGEENAKDADGSKPTWVIDPIDGTANFLRGLPLYAISIGLVIDGDVEVGVIHLPRLFETYEASKGGGAFLDGKAITAASTRELKRAAVGIGSSLRTSQEGPYAVFHGLTDAGVDVRRLGSACCAIAYVASGRLDGYAEQHLNSWDVIAGLCIAREAGARTNHFLTGDWLKSGNAWVCAAPGIYDALEHIALPS